MVETTSNSAEPRRKVDEMIQNQVKDDAVRFGSLQFWPNPTEYWPNATQSWATRRASGQTQSNLGRFHPDVDQTQLIWSTQTNHWSIASRSCVEPNPKCERIPCLEALDAPILRPIFRSPPSPRATNSSRTAGLARRAAAGRRSPRRGRHRRGARAWQRGRCHHRRARTWPREDFVHMHRHRQCRHYAARMPELAPIFSSLRSNRFCASSRVNAMLLASTLARSL